MSWKSIPEFPDYSVSDQGEVRSDRYNRIRNTSMTAGGAAKVTLFKGDKPYTRSLALLVTQAHVWNDYDPEFFNTPIHLNNDLMDNRSMNLAWRPRWFALKYQKQYYTEEFRFATTSVIDLETALCYHNLHEPCQEFGLLYVDILRSCSGGGVVFPTWKEFIYGPKE